MDPNQQPNQTPPNPGPTPPQQGFGQSQPVQRQPFTGPLPAPQPPQQQGYPQPPSAYQAPAGPQPYDPGYLDSIAPPPPKQAFLSGSFGKIFFGLIFLFVIAVSFIVAFSGQDKTADLQQLSVRLENIQKTAKNQQKNLKSGNLKNINTDFTTWLAGNFSETESLLKEGGVKKSQYDKKMVSSEKARTEELDQKFEDARLNATLNQTYANSMSAETEELVNALNSMSRRSQSAKIRDFAAKAKANLQPIQDRFEKYNDDGNN